MIPDTVTSPIVVPPEVHKVAAEQGVAEYLPAVVDLTRRVFPMSQRVIVFADDDGEIPNSWHIIFEVLIPPDVSQAVALERQWTEGLFECCPAPLVHVFLLSMDLKG